MIDVIYETQASFYEYIERVVIGTQNIADYLREDRIGEAMQLIMQFSEGVSWLTQVIILMREHHYYIDIHPSKINQFLIEINEGLERQDYVIVADMFEYEIQPFFEEAREKCFAKVGE
ncbi:hypothetical protein GFC29_2423 [Anoxybacillus sp. B7M1]|uniref:hypothetical protein n=1 Tax=unclassified Anoxybacillus TaxID=2639704 RepID=UPI0005CDBCEA|nr:MULTISPECIES: hypothetical protein [unclassified Anoxybacillus]ANB57884.1 hypothetical protein GFC28_3012 [Anoxybacillus sp. B2M1]ANB63044.1 hypothetical protein GFC29_2423 [Anoxybacillus sp. B7M1]